MSVDKLLRDGKIHKFMATAEEIDKVIDIARRDLSLAKKIAELNRDWCFSILYNSVFQICRAYMFSQGYRPASHETHKTVFEFMSEVVEAPYKGMISYFDRARKKRHRSIYDEVGLVSSREIGELLAKANRFIEYIVNKLKG